MGFNRRGLVKMYSKVVERNGKRRWTLMLPGAGCEYWKKTGGCRMCGFNNATKRYSRGLLYPSFIFKSLYYAAEAEEISQSPEQLSVFNGGSFWNDNEIPADFQNYLCRKVEENDSLNAVMIESRCEYITSRKVKNALELLNGKRLKVGIGLESQDDFVRNMLIHKGLAKKDFEDKVGLLRKAGADVMAYVFLKPLGLGEKKAITEALKSIKYALSIGVTEIELSSAFVQEGTMMAASFHHGKFRPPYLWSMLEIIQEVIKNDWPVSIGGFEDEPAPIAIPANCPNCSPRIYQTIEQFRQTRRLGPIPNCSCKDYWDKI